MPRIQSYHLHLPFYHLDDSKNVRLLYAIRIMRDLVNKISLFFLPIFLFQLGQETTVLAFIPVTTFQRGMISIGLFYGVSRFISLVIALPIGIFIKKAGYHISFIYSYLFRITAFIFLYLAVINPFFVIGAIVAEAIQTNLFWNSYHAVLSKNTLKMHVGSNLGILQFLLQLVAVITPFLSGILASVFGLNIIFLFGIIGTIISFMISVNMTLGKDQSKVSFSEYKEWMREPAFRRFTIAQAGRYIHDAILFLWPLYIFLILGSVEEVGYLYTLSLFIVLVLTVFMGFFINSSKTRKPFYVSGGLLSGVWLARTQVLSIFGIAIIDAIDKILSNFHWLYYDTVFLRRAKGKAALSYFVYSELINSFAGFFFWFAFCAFFYFFDQWSAVFVFGAVSVMMSTLMSDREKIVPGKEV